MFCHIEKDRINGEECYIVRVYRSLKESFVEPPMDTYQCEEICTSEEVMLDLFEKGSEEQAHRVEELRHKVSKMFDDLVEFLDRAKNDKTTQKGE